VLSSQAIQHYGNAIRALRAFTQAALKSTKGVRIIAVTAFAMKGDDDERSDCR
jgi:hypothetical protein